MGVKIRLFEVGSYRPYSFRFLSVGMDEKRSLQRKSKEKGRIGRSHYEECCPHKARTSTRPREGYGTRTITKRVEKCIDVDGGIFEDVFELLQFIEIIYLTNKCNQ